MTRKTPGGTIWESRIKLGYNTNNIQRVNPDGVVGCSRCSRIQELGNTRVVDDAQVVNISIREFKEVKKVMLL